MGGVAVRSIDHSDIRGSKSHGHDPSGTAAPRTKRTGWGRSPYRIKHEEGSTFRGPCALIGSAVQENIDSACLRGCCELLLLFSIRCNRPNKVEQLSSQSRHDLILVLAMSGKCLVSLVQPILRLSGDLLHFIGWRQGLLPAQQKPSDIGSVLVSPGRFDQHSSQMRVACVGRIALDSVAD